MKKKLLPLALAAAAGLTGVTAQAVHVNNDGTGQVLLYPFYTVEGTQDTLISLVNTTGQTKAVKVRILEAMNSKEVLDFNLYLSPSDHWSAVITRNAAGDGAVIRTGDTSCTSPLSLASTTVGGAGATVAFRTFEFDGSSVGSTADSIAGVERTQEGYVEVIEMGEIDNTGAFDADILHSQTTGLPADCVRVDANTETGGAVQTATTAPTGGLYGYGVLINPVDGTAVAYDATALDNFSDTAGHTEPGNLLPALSEADPESDQIAFDGTNYAAIAATFATTANPGLDAVSSVLMARAIVNDYVLEPTLNAGTDWVITFPTKRDYVAGVVATAPFTAPWDPTNSSSCEEIEIEYFDREEGIPQAAPTTNDFSPRPPAGAPDVLSLCYEANIMTFNGSDVLSGSDRVKRDFSLESKFVNGWAQVNLDSVAGRSFDSDAAAETFNGLPVIGFAVQKYVNGAVGGSLANYAASITHKRTGNQ